MNSYFMHRRFTRRVEQKILRAALTVLVIWLCQSCLIAQSKVELVVRDGGYQLLRNGTPYQVKGVGGDTRLSDLAAAGGNSIRTWDANNLGQVLDRAHQDGLTVCAGLWLGHQRHGFDYQNQEAVIKQLEECLAAVREHKDHPALLLWAVGNEMEGMGTDPSVLVRSESHRP